MATVNTTDSPQQAPVVAEPITVIPAPTGQMQELRIYGHSSIFYWWPVWTVGFILAIITRIGGHLVQVPGSSVEVMIHPSKNLGVIYALVLFLVILFTNTTVRGLASVIVILTVMFLTVLFAWLGWWEAILGLMPHLAGYINLGFYTIFSLALFVFWAGTVFVYDRMSYWSLRPGQITHRHLIGGGEMSYDTRGMLFEKTNQDLFRHYLLGLGSGDMRIITTGARQEEILIPNVLFVDSHLHAMQQLVATKPDQATNVMQG